MKRLINLVSFGLVAVAAYAGCSSDDTTSKPASSTDAGASGTDSGGSTDSGGTVQDSGGAKDSGTIQDTGSTADTGNAACTAYCTCMHSTCPTEEPANCVTACQSQTTWDLSCRTTHCGLAGSGGDAGASLHCGHASGVSTCQ